MTDHLGLRMVCSRGRVCCDRCGRRIPKGTRYEQYDYADGGIYHSRTCPTCLDIEGYVADDLDPDMPWGPSESWEWAHEAMGWWSGWSDSVLGDADPSLAAIALRTLSRDVEAAAGLDNDPAQAWGEEAWAAFTWCMQTSSCIADAKGHSSEYPPREHASDGARERVGGVESVLV